MSVLFWLSLSSLTSPCRFYGLKCLRQIKTPSLLTRCPSFSWFLAASICHKPVGPEVHHLSPSYIPQGWEEWLFQMAQGRLKTAEPHYTVHFTSQCLTHNGVARSYVLFSVSGLDAVTQIDGFSQPSLCCSLLTIWVSAHPHTSVSCQTPWISCLFIDL